MLFLLLQYDQKESIERIESKSKSAETDQKDLLGKDSKSVEKCGKWD